MTLALEIRRKSLRGSPLWCTLAFSAVLLSSTVMIIAITLYSTSWLATLSLFGWESYPVASTRPDEYASWIVDAARRWPEVRGDGSTQLSQWISLSIVVTLLCIVGYGGFSKPGGRSLTSDGQLNKTPARVRRILEDFGYFKDILVDDEGKDVMAARRQIVFPSGLIKNLTNDKPPSLEEERNLQFFMAHEFAHTLTLDNVAHSLIKLIFWVTTAMTSALLLLFITASVLISAPTLGNQVLFLILCVSIITLIIYCLTASIRNVIFSYLKTREYFADAVGYDRVPNEAEPYRFKAEGPTSAWDRSTSKLERDLHRRGVSLNARNMLPALLVLFVSLRSLYLGISPANAEWAVLAFDTVFLAAFFVLALKLPPTMPSPADRPLLPWLAAAIALLALFLSVPGLLGMLLHFHHAPVIAESTGMLLVWPVLFALAICVWFSLWLSGARLFRRGETLPQKTPAPIGTRVRRAMLALMAAPGRIFSALLLIILLGIGTMQLTNALENLLRPELSATAKLVAGNSIMAALLLSLGCLVYRNQLFLRRGLMLVETALTALPLAGVAIAMTIAASSQLETRAEDGISRAAQMLTTPSSDQLAAGYDAAIVTVSLYILAKLLEYSSRKLSRKSRIQGGFNG